MEQVMDIPTRFSPLTLVFGLMIVTAQAGQDDSSGIERRLLECDQIADSAAKLACIEMVIKVIKEDEGPDTGSFSESNLDSPAPDSSTAPADTATGVAAGAGAIPEQVATDQPGDSILVDEVPSAAQSGIAPQADSIEEFGLEDQIVAEQKEALKNVEEEIDEIRAIIVDSWETIDRRFEVLLDNGQIWRETELTRTPRLPKAGSTVRITRASLGSYRMKIGNNNRLAAVRRTR